MSGENKELGQLIIKSTRMALEDIIHSNLEIYPEDTQIQIKHKRLQP